MEPEHINLNARSFIVFVVKYTETESDKKELISLYENIEKLMHSKASVFRTRNIRKSSFVSNLEEEEGKFYFFVKQNMTLNHFDKSVLKTLTDNIEEVVEYKPYIFVYKERKDAAIKIFTNENRNSKYLSILNKKFLRDEESHVPSIENEKQMV